MTISRLPSGPCSWHQETTRLLYAKLGFKNKVVPKNAHGAFRIDGWDIIVRRSARTGRSGKPRVFARVSGQLVDVGRLRQTLCAITVQRSQVKAARQRGAGGRFR